MFATKLFRCIQQTFTTRNAYSVHTKYGRFKKYTFRTINFTGKLVWNVFFLFSFLYECFKNVVKHKSCVWLFLLYFIYEPIAKNMAYTATKISKIKRKRMPLLYAYLTLSFTKHINKICIHTRFHSYCMLGSRIIITITMVVMVAISFVLYSEGFEPYITVLYGLNGKIVFRCALFALS